ncbi:MAG: CaiB/BaiF CoA-transferase family protein, partial [Pseudomonadota bacterium]
PLTDIRVIELGQLVAGPFCGQLFADMGADVIKIEAPGKGDPLREWGQEGYPLWWRVCARNKRSVTANLREADGQDLVRRLVGEADILIENFRPGTMEKWGLGYDALSAINAGLIMIRISGYGQTGPYASRPGYASVGEAMGGLRYVMGEPDRVPSRAGISIGDTLTGTFATYGALAALHHRHKTGKGQIVDASIYESVLSVMESLVPDQAVAGYRRERSGSFLKGIAPSNIYTASDGMLIIAANQDTLFKRLAKAMGMPELADDPDYHSHTARGSNQIKLDALINEWTSQRSLQQLEETLSEHAVPFGRLYRASDMIDDPHFKARDAIIDVPTPRFPDLKMQNIFPKLSKTPGRVRHAGTDQPGDDTIDVLTGLLDLTEDQIHKLKNSGIV